MHAPCYDYVVKSDVCIYENINITLISFLQISDINPTFMFIPCKMCSEVKFVYQHMVECNFWTLSKHLNEAHNIIVKRLEWISKAIVRTLKDEIDNSGYLPVHIPRNLLNRKIYWTDFCFLYSVFVIFFVVSYLTRVSFVVFVEIAFENHSWYSI